VLPFFTLVAAVVVQEADNLQELLAETAVAVLVVRLTVTISAKTVLVCQEQLIQAVVAVVAVAILHQAQVVVQVLLLFVTQYKEKANE
jgi:uncharacterized membrane protein